MTATEPQAIVRRLQEHATIGGAPLRELEWLAAHGELQVFRAGQRVIRQGEATAGELFVLLTGHVALYANRGRGRRKIVEWHAGEVTGILPYSRASIAVGDAVPEADTEVWAVDRAHFAELTRECPELTAILVHVMVDRARHFTTADLRDEKLMALGKLAAGLAHELNNPASAMVRSAKSLRELLDEGKAAARAMGALGLSEAQLAEVDAVRAACLAVPVRTWSPIERADREDALAAWIESHGADVSLAAPLADTAVSPDLLQQLERVVPPAALEMTVRWMANECAVRSLTEEIERSADRVFELVSAVKGFTQMDRSTVPQPVDVGRGLGDTIIVLRSRAAAKSISLSATIDPRLPPVQGVGAELNQIWANLIDNAIDAVATGGRVEVVARREGNRVVVEIVDDGPGIPADVRPQIFDPFFSTKDVGQGVGLGLDIVRRSLERHDGEIDVESRPGRTVFRVRLPAEGMRSTGRFSRATQRIQIAE